MKRNRVFLGGLIWVVLNSTLLVSCSDDDASSIQKSHAELQATDKETGGLGGRR